jgi:hypothetical protein
MTDAPGLDAARRMLSTPGRKAASPAWPARIIRRRAALQKPSQPARRVRASRGMPG